MKIIRKKQLIYQISSREMLKMAKEIYEKIEELETRFKDTLKIIDARI